MSRHHWRPPFGNQPRWRRDKFSERSRQRRLGLIWLAVKITAGALGVGMLAAAVIAWALR